MPLLLAILDLEGKRHAIQVSCYSSDHHLTVNALIDRSGKESTGIVAATFFRPSHRQHFSNVNGALNLETNLACHDHAKPPAHRTISSLLSQ